MEPTFKLEQIVAIDSAQVPEPGDCIVVALLATDEVLFRRYRPHSGTQPVEPPYKLIADENFFEPREIPSQIGQSSWAL